MPRPAGDSKERLIQAGKAILAEKGFSGLSVRAVAARAKVNLAMVGYHFGGMQALVEELAQGSYEEFFRDFSLQVEGEHDPLKALRLGLLRLARFMRDHRGMVAGLIRDALNGESQARSFMRANGPRHGVILMKLVKRCVGRGQMQDLPLPVLMSTIMGVVAFPTLMAGPMASVVPRIARSVSRAYIERSLLTDKALELRVDLALKMLERTGGARS